MINGSRVTWETLFGIKTSFATFAVILVKIDVTSFVKKDYLVVFGAKGADWRELAHLCGCLLSHS